jgi:isoaspartyl peptidase/L-asparaginase-like protein (Ntn-hydrolase superfamily)
MEQTTSLPSNSAPSVSAPCVLATWSFSGACVDLASKLLMEDGESSSIDAVCASIRLLEEMNEEQYYVGVGGYPNAKGIMEFDAAIMNHHCNYGAVLGLQEVTTPISVAR